MTDDVKCLIFSVMVDEPGVDVFSYDTIYKILPVGTMTQFAALVTRVNINSNNSPVYRFYISRKYRENLMRLLNIPLQDKAPSSAVFSNQTVTNNDRLEEDVDDIKWSLCQTSNLVKTLLVVNAITIILFAIIPWVIALIRGTIA